MKSYAQVLGIQIQSQTTDNSEGSKTNNTKQKQIEMKVVIENKELRQVIGEMKEQIR